ncbi:MAG: outer membrane beta-barrel protein, partial [Gammaproteobacteria bacterium]
GEFDAEGFRDTGVEIIGLEAAVMGIALPGEDVEIFGRLGLYLWDAEFEMLGEDAGDDDDTSLSFGIGANFRITESISGRIGYTRYDDISDEDVDTLTLGTVAYF